jgi:hypothetical protein
MAFTQADLDALDAALRTGAMRVDFPGGGGTTYRSVAEMLRIRDMIAADVAKVAGTTPVRRLKIYATKDL